MLISRRALAPRSSDSGSKPELLEESSAWAFLSDLDFEVWSPSGDGDEEEEEEEKG